jgi:hypothetical protein
MRNLYEILVAFVRANKLGWVMPEGIRYILVGDKDDVQRAICRMCEVDALRRILSGREISKVRQIWQ